MKKNQLFLGLATIAAAVFSFSSCSQDELSTAKAETPNLGQEILLSTNFSTTRSVSQNIQNAQIASGIQVGTFITTTGSTTGFVTNGNNKPFTADGSGGLTVSGDKVYYPNNANVDIYAYAPYQSGWNVSDVNADQNFTVQADQSSDDNYKASDLIWAKKTNQASSESALALVFTHNLSKININIVNNRTGLSLKGATVSILNTVRTATINPSTGAVAAKDGVAASAITVATYGTVSEPTATTESPATASAIIVPQTLAAGTNFIKIVTDATHNNSKSTTLYAKLGAGGKTFDSANQYSYKVTINQQSVELSLGGTTISAWTDNLGELEAEDAPDIGDYILKDGTFLKKEAVTDENKANIVAVIFSTTPSTTDAAANYDGYAMGLKRIGSGGGAKKQWYVNTSYNVGLGTLADGYADMDGLTKCATIKASDTYKNLESKTEHIVNLDNYSLTIDAGAIVGSETDGNKNLSGWFTPSFGQLIAILNNLGEAGITNGMKTIEGNWSNYSEFYVNDNAGSSGIAISGVIDKINDYVTAAGQSDILAVGNIDLGTVTENSEQSGEKFWMFSVGNGNWKLTAAQAKVGSGGVKEVCVIPCLAYKIQ